MESSQLVNLIIGLMLPIYVLCVWIPSVTINGIIVTVCVLQKDLHTPVSIITAHISFTGLLVSLLYNLVSFADFILVMIHCDCQLTYYLWLISHFLHLSVYPLNGLSLSVCYFCVLKFSSHVLTVKRVVTGIIVIWVISLISNLPLVFLTPFDTFVSCCEETCLNVTYSMCNIGKAAFSPNRITTAGYAYMTFRDITIPVGSTFIVAVFTIASYIVFKKSFIRNSTPLERRMLLLPILMTVSFILFFVIYNLVNWNSSLSPPTTLPGTFYFSVVYLWDFVGLSFAVLVLYFNVLIRSSCINLIKHCFIKNRVSPSNIT